MKARLLFRTFRLAADAFDLQKLFLEPFTRSKGFCLSALCLFIGLPQAVSADFAVTYAGSSAYAFNGAGANPTLTVVRGQTYTFAVNTSSSHPFRINSTGAVNNPTFSGTITWTVPLTASNYTYRCTIHGFGGSIVTIPPPTFRIVNLSVGQNLVLKSTGTNNWTSTPQYSTNLGGTNWFALTVLSNRFNNGTNETFCGRPPVSNAFIRISAQRN